MGKTVGRFGFHILDGGERLHTPLAYITVATRTVLKDGQICVTPQMTELEIDTCVMLLKEDLDSVARRAKAAIKRAKAAKSPTL